MFQAAAAMRGEGKGQGFRVRPRDVLCSCEWGIGNVVQNFTSTETKYLSDGASVAFTPRFKRTHARMPTNVAG